MKCAYCGLFAPRVGLRNADAPQNAGDAGTLGTTILSPEGETTACCAATGRAGPGLGPGFVPSAIQRGVPLDFVPARGVARVLVARGPGPVTLVNPHAVNLGGGTRAATYEVVGVAV